MDHFGYYMHHAPTTESEEVEHRSHLQSLPRLERAQARKDRMRGQYEYIYDHLGKDTFVKWYLEYPKTFSYRRLAELQLQAVDARLEGMQPRQAEAA